MPLLKNMAQSLREIANLLDHEVDLGPQNFNILHDFLSKFSPLEIFPTSDFSSRCPPEVLEHILHYLPPRDLKNAVGVNKKWLKVGEKAKLWSWSMLSLQAGVGSLPEGFALLQSPRGIKSVEAFYLSTEESVELMAAVAQNSWVEELCLDGCSLEEVERGVLSSAVFKLSKVKLVNLTLSEEQLAALFSSNCKVSTLAMEEVVLSSVPPGLLASAARVLELSLSNCLLTPEQISTLWTAVGNGSNFRSIDVAGMELTNVDQAALKIVAERAFKIGLSNTSLTEAQMTALVTSLDQNKSVLELDLSDNPLTAVNPQLLARVASRCRKLNLANTGITATQVTQILDALTFDNCLMESLDLSGNNLSMVDAHLMAEAFNKLKIVTLLDTNLSVNQVCHNIRFFILLIHFGIPGVTCAEAGFVRHIPYQILDLTSHREESPHFCSTLVWQC